MSTVYVASKVKHAEMWRRHRIDWGRMGITVVSTWIDEAGEGETADFSEFWDRIVQEAVDADYLIAYHEPGEVWKGAFLEIGASLATGGRVFLIGEPPGTWPAHPRVRPVHSLQEAIHEILSDMEIARIGFTG